MNTLRSPLQRTAYSFVACAASMGLMLAGNDSTASLASSQDPVVPLALTPVLPELTGLTVASTSPTPPVTDSSLDLEVSTVPASSGIRHAAPEADLQLSSAPRTVSDPALSVSASSESMQEGDLDFAYWNLGTQDVLLQRAAKDYQSEAWEDQRQQAAQQRILEPQAPRTADEVNGALRHLRKRPTFRGALDLINPFAPVPEPSPSLAVMDAETRRPLVQPTPRVFHDAIWHEGGLRLW
jgi:hypothetical protein